MEQGKQNLSVIALWATGLLCLLLSTYTVLTSLLQILSLILYSFGFVQVEPDAAEKFTKALEHPVSSLGISVFNGTLWLMVVVMCINLLRLREWSRIGLLTLIGVDLVATFAVALYNAYQYRILGPDGFSLTTTVAIPSTVLEVLIAIILCHPAVIALTRVDDPSIHPPQPHEDRPWDRS